MQQEFKYVYCKSPLSNSIFEKNGSETFLKNFSLPKSDNIWQTLFTKRLSFNLK